MDQFTRTWKYKDLIKNLDNFMALANIYMPTEIVLTEVEWLMICKTLWNEYCNCSVAFDMKENFYRKFYNILWNEAEYYAAKLAKIKEIRAMTNEQLITEYTNLTNMASNNNKIVDNPLSEVLPYITSQTSGVTKSNLLGAIGRAIRNYSNYHQKQFIDKFGDLFLDLFAGEVVYYNKED